MLCSCGRIFAGTQTAVDYFIMRTQRCDLCSALLCVPFAVESSRLSPLASPLSVCLSVCSPPSAGRRVCRLSSQSAGERQIKCQFVLPVVSLFVRLFILPRGGGGWMVDVTLLFIRILHIQILFSYPCLLCPFCVNNHLHVYLIWADLWWLWAPKNLKAKAES